MKASSLICLVALFAMAACDDDPLGTPATARVRIVNAANTNATVNAFRGSVAVGGDVAFQTATACAALTVPTGQHVISFRNTDSATRDR